MQTYFDAKLKAEGLTMARARALHFLVQPRTWTQAELADELDIERPSAVRLIDGMEAAGLVKRVPVPWDRRANHLELTNQAKPLLEIIDQLAQAGQTVLLEGIDDHDLEITLTVLSKIAKNAASNTGGLT
ncbi:transcriptional regulator, MarR family [Rhizobium sp. NFR03]|nr:transcriptional regulator, MarR family [Rhizobium sp. NFR03]